jgi:hypothetical protein
MRQPSWIAREVKIKRLARTIEDRDGLESDPEGICRIAFPKGS